MSKLFIIGNGFDLAHHIESSYTNFRDYLLQKDEISILDMLTYESSLDHDWCNFEEALGTINLESRLGTYIRDAEVADNDSYIAGTNMITSLDSVYNGELKQLAILFKKWITDIDTEQIMLKKIFLNLLKKKRIIFFHI